MGKLLIFIGGIIVAIGLLYTYFPQAISWFGNLPGDIKIEKPNTKVYFPITSMIVLSVLFSLVMRLMKVLG